MATLGTGNYTVSIVFSADPTQTVGVLPWSKLSWQRVANQPSEAKFTIPHADGGIECCGIFGGLRPWDHMLVIERNNYVVWDGPILGFATDDDGNVEIRAADRSVLMAHLFIGATRLWPAGTAELETILVRILEDIDFSNSPFGLTFDVDFESYFLPPRPADVDLHAERLDHLDTVIGQIAETTNLYWSCRSDVIQFCEYKARGGLTPEGIIPGHPLGFDNRWLTLSERTVLTRPRVVMDGTRLATQVLLGGSSSGSNGHAIIATVDLSTAAWYLAGGDPPPYILSTIPGGGPNLTQFDVESVQAVAEQTAVEVSTPSLTIEQLQLAPSFGGRQLLPSLDNLLPGTRFNLAFENTCAFSVPSSRGVYAWSVISGGYDYSLAWAGDTMHARLDQLDVDVDEKGETVKGSFTSTVEVLSGPVTISNNTGASVSKQIVY